MNDKKNIVLSLDFVTLIHKYTHRNIYNACKCLRKCEVIDIRKYVVYREQFQKQNKQTKEKLSQNKEEKKNSYFRKIWKILLIFF